MYTNKDMKRMKVQMNESDSIKKGNRNPGRMKLGFILDNGQKNMKEIPFGPRLLYYDLNVQCMNIFIISITP
jgi:hypothetical protein